MLNIYDQLKIADTIKYLSTLAENENDLQKDLDVIFNSAIDTEKPFFVSCGGVVWQLDVTVSSWWDQVINKKNKHKWKLTKTKL